MFDLSHRCPTCGKRCSCTFVEAGQACNHSCAGEGMTKTAPTGRAWRCPTCGLEFLVPASNTRPVCNGGVTHEVTAMVPAGPGGGAAPEAEAQASDFIREHSALDDYLQREVVTARPEEIVALVEATRAAALEQAAKVATSSNFDDGPKGTIEGQIAAAIRALANPEDKG